jgi:hypothetical protein
VCGNASPERKEEKILKGAQAAMGNNERMIGLDQLSDTYTWAQGQGTMKC